MSKPDDIRQDDWDAAIAVLTARGMGPSQDPRFPDEMLIDGPFGDVFSFKIEPIARAIAAGRLAGLKEAAQVATDYANDHGEYPGLPQAGNSIAAAILALTEGKEPG